MNKFNEGDDAVCISNDFPHIEKYGGEKGGATYTPKKGEILTVDEILGEFIRFDKYDTEESYNWWHHTRFDKINMVEIQESIEELIHESLDTPKIKRL